MRRALSLIIAAALGTACDQPETRILGPEDTPELAMSLYTAPTPSPAEVFPAGMASTSPTLLSLNTTVVDMRTAPGPDGIPGTADDITFDASFTPRYQRTDGTTTVNWASPIGNEWAVLGLLFEPTDGAVALTFGGGGCLGSQLPAPAPVYPNWDGGVGIDFIGPMGGPATVSRISVEVAGIASALEAFDVAGNTLGTVSAGSYRDVLTISATGIARAELTGQFWCIATYVEFDDLTVSALAVIAQIEHWVQTGEVDPGVGSSLISMLQAANAAIARGDDAAGSNALQAFANHVAAQSGKHISTSAAVALVAWAQALLATL